MGYRDERLIDPRAGDKLSAGLECVQNSILRRSLLLPNSTTDSSGTRMVVHRQPKTRIRCIEITHIDHTSLGFQMANYGICLGKYVDFDVDQDWDKKYDDTILEYDPDDSVVTDPIGRYVFIGFIDQSRAGVPGQRYLGLEYGSKTVSGLSVGDITLPLVMVNGGSPTAGVLAENHPGCGTVFEIWISPLWDPTKDSSNGDWDLSHATEIWDIDGCDGSVKFKAIDKRLWGITPDKYATGLFVPRCSKTYGVILEVIELDCESPGGCYFCEATEE